MTKLNWGAFGERYFETGIDRGVLYLPGRDGVAWSGLIGVREAPTGGDPTPYYIDGYKYANVSTSEEYAATLEAFSAPLEFNECDGRAEISPGLVLDQQPRKSFSFSYRTRIGNDLEGTDHGYKIHIVYNALAEPTTRTYATLSDSPDADVLSWDITSLPPRIPGRKPTSHLIIDSRRMHPVTLALIEAYLYGSEGVSPRLPSADRIIAWIAEMRDFVNSDISGPIELRGNVPYAAEEFRNLVTNPRGRHTSGTVTIRENLSLDPRPRSVWSGTTDPDVTFMGKPSQRATGTTMIVGENVVAKRASVVAGKTYTITVWMMSPEAFTGRVRYYLYSTGTTFSDYGPEVSVPANEWTPVSATFTVEEGQTSTLPMAYGAPSGQTWWVGAVLIEESEASLPYFDGDTWDGDPDFTPEWTGAPGASTSRLVAPNPAGWQAQSLGKVFYSQTHDAVGMILEPIPDGYADDEYEKGLLIVTYGSITTLGEHTSVLQLWTDTGNPLYDPYGVEIPTGGTHHRPGNPHLSYAFLLNALSKVGAPVNTLYLRAGAVLGEYDGPYFDGDTEDAAYNGQILETAWEDVPHNSESFAVNITSLPARSKHGDMVFVQRPGANHLYVQQNGLWRNQGEPPAFPT